MGLVLSVLSRKSIPLLMSIKLYSVWAVQRHRRSHGQKVAVDEADVSIVWEN